MLKNEFFSHFGSNIIKKFNFATIFYPEIELQGGENVVCL